MNLQTQYQDTSPLLSIKTTLIIWVIYQTEDFKSHIQMQLETQNKLKGVFVHAADLTSLTQKESIAPDLIFVEAKDNWMQTIDDLQSLSYPFKEISAALIVFGDESDPMALKSALKLGASDFLSQNSNIEQLSDLLVHTAQEKLSNSVQGESFAFINTKGGTGTTTVAMNTALVLAEYHPGKVLFLDMDNQFGVAASYMDIYPKYNIQDVYDELDGLDESSLSALVTQLESGLHFLSLCQNSVFNDIDRNMNVEQFFSVLRRYYDYIVVDFSRGVEPFMAEAISHFTKVILVVQQNITSIRNASLIAKALSFDYGVSSEQQTLLVNRFEKRQQIGLQDIQHTLPNVECHCIPNDFKNISESNNLGNPVVLSKPSSALSKAFHVFAASLVPIEHKSQSWFERLLS
ncbi:AAA family ATPase [Vibrio rumoiensis]|uniref:AAA family ATPase n=1 Tax=Vibrio rumoiensis TaxID=76258 RepID=A0ABW7IXV9_9VIBR